MRALRTDYTFDASAKTVTFAGAVTLERLLLIVNATDGVIVYNFAAETGTLVGTTVTLAHDTTAMDDTDDLVIFYETDSVDVAGTVAISNFPATQPVSGSVSVSNLPATQAVSAASLPLPSGAATETTLAALNTKVPSSPAAEHTTAASPNAARLTDGSSFYKATTPADTQPVSGTVTANIGTGGSLATSANQTSELTKLDQLHTDLTGTLTTGLPTGASTSANQTSELTKLDTLHADLGHLTDGTQTIVLPTGAATSALQTSGNALLTAIDAGIPAGLGATTPSASMPVALPVVSGTLQSAATGLGNGSTLDVTGMGSIVFQTTISATATVTFEGSNDGGTTWNALTITASSSNNVSTTGVIVTSAATAAIGGYTLVRARISSYGSGTVTVVATASAAAPRPLDRLIVSGVTANGSAVGGNNPVSVAGSDGTNARALSTDTSGRQIVVGGAASGSAVAGSPLLTGGSDGTNARTFLTQADADALANTATALAQRIVAADYLFNGSTWDRRRANTTAAVIAAGTTTSQSAIALTTYSARGLVLVVNITAGTGSLVMTVKGVTSSSYTYNMLVTGSLTAVGFPLTYDFHIGPGLTPSPGVTANDVIPRSVTITTVLTGTATYGVDAILGV